MTCAWKELLSILPAKLKQKVDLLGKETLQELRLRRNTPPELILNGISSMLPSYSTQDDLNFVVNAASRYSPWTASSAAYGYITAPGGHRIGICGEVVCKGGVVTGIRRVDSLCIRVARDYPGISKGITATNTSILILGPPAWGKTTLLRDLIRQISKKETICVVDERGELFPDGFSRGNRTDILLGSPKAAGIDMLIRTMGPRYIAVDEITAKQDALSLLQAANCGVKLIATAHASSLKDFQSRIIYQPLIINNVFQTLVILNQDKSYTQERMEECDISGSEP